MLLFRLEVDHWQVHQGTSSRNSAAVQVASSCRCDPNKRVDFSPAPAPAPALPLWPRGERATTARRWARPAAASAVPSPAKWLLGPAGGRTGAINHTKRMHVSVCIQCISARILERNTGRYSQIHADMHSRLKCISVCILCISSSFLAWNTGRYRQIHADMHSFGSAYLHVSACIFHPCA